MLTATKFIDCVGIGSSKCFKVIADDDNVWVVKARIIEKNAKRLFNEYIAGTLAKEFGLSSPKVDLIKIEDVIYDQFDEIKFDRTCRVGIALEFIENLTQVTPPPNIFDDTIESHLTNREHLRKIFGNNYNFMPFYGHRLFTEWVLLEDNYNYRNLYITPQRVPIFLDFDFSFGGAGWDILPAQYSFTRMIGIPELFHKGVITNIVLFEPWFESLNLLNKSQFKKYIDELPDEWDIPQGYVSSLMNLLFDNRVHFVNEFKYAFEIYKSSKLANY